ncbi:MAG: signal peptidase II [Desulfitobacteriia bacterium]
MPLWLTLILVLVLDRISKLLVVSKISLGESIPVIPDFFHLTYILNPGAAFGILAGQKWFFVVISFLFLGAVIYFNRKIPREHKLMKIALGLVCGGTLGNLLDRLFIGQVIDFLDFKVWSYIFNIADSALVIGGLALAILVYRWDKNK